jgi:hypothetical protein
MIEEQTKPVKHLQCVVFGRIVGGSDSQAAHRAANARKNLNSGRWQHSYVQNFASGSQQTTVDRVLEHGTAGASISSHYHPARTYIRSERLRECPRQSGSQELAHHAANPGDANFQQMFFGPQISFASSPAYLKLNFKNSLARTKVYWHNSDICRS